MKNKYALFAATRHQETGGWGDFKGVFSTLWEAQTKFSELKLDYGLGTTWAEIVDLEKLEVVLRKPSALTYWKESN